MFAAQSHVRNACDACHKRKIRCIVSTSGGPCHNCKARGLSCYFLPRHRSGRPRLRDSSSPDTIDTHSITPVTENTMPRTPAIKSPHPRADHQSSNDYLFSWDSHQDFAMQTEQHNYDLQDPDQPLKFPSVLNGPVIDMQQRTFLNFANSTRHPFTNIQSEDLPDATSRSRLDMQASVWSTTSQQPCNRSGPRYEMSKDAGFATLLECCARLQRHIMTTGESGCTISEDSTSSTLKKIEISDCRLKEVLEDIDFSCKLMLEICDEGTSSKSTSASVNSLPDSAFISLITTVTFKVFQICEILFNGQGLKVRSIKDVLLQKRLDFNITQAGIVTARIEHLTHNTVNISKELLEKAVHIEERFISQRGRSYADVGEFRS